MAPVTADPGGKGGEGLHRVRDRGLGLLLWARGEAGRGPREEGVSSRCWWQSPGCGARLAGGAAWGPGFLLLAQSPSSDVWSCLQARPQNQSPPPEREVFSPSPHPPPHWHLSTCLSTHHPPTCASSLSHFPASRHQAPGGGEEGSRDQRGREADLSTRPSCAARWLSRTPREAGGQEPPRRGHGSRALTTWRALAHRRSHSLTPFRKPLELLLDPRAPC